MKRNARKAFTALKKKGAAVFENGADYGAHFILSGEDNHPAPVADYYQEYLTEYEDRETGKIHNAFGIADFVHDILKKNDLYVEWINPGMLGVYDV